MLGRVDEQGRLRVAGRTTPLALPARRELGAVLAPPRGAHPWPDRIPSSRFGQLPPEPVDYTPAEPSIVVEVDADAASNTAGGVTPPSTGGFDPTCGERTCDPQR